MIKNFYIGFVIILLVVIIVQLYRRKDVEFWNPEKVPQYIVDKNQCVIYTSYNTSYKDKPFVKLNAQILQEYSRINGHIYKQIIHPDDFMSPYWTRVYDLVKLMNTYPEGTIIMYLDADAVPKSSVKDISLNHFLTSIDIQKNRRGNFYVSEDPNVRYDLFYKGIFNSGVFIVRNNKETRNMANKWMNMYNKDHTWVLEDDKWQCKINDRTCFWSFKGYEQYALTELYKMNKNFFTKLHWTTLACNKEENPNCYIMHLMGHSDNQRELVFKKTLKEYYN